MLKLGVLLLVAGPLLALYTGNLFGFSKKIKKNLANLERESKRNSRSDYFYYKSNELIRTTWPIITATGALIVIADFLGN